MLRDPAAGGHDELLPAGLVDPEPVGIVERPHGQLPAAVVAHHAADGHGDQRQAGHQEADGGTRQDGMRHGVAHQAHAPEDQDDTQWAGTQR